MNLALLLAVFKATGAKVEERNAGGLPYYKIWGPSAAQARGLRATAVLG
jgi:hypothetical protein